MTVDISLARFRGEVHSLIQAYRGYLLRPKGAIPLRIGILKEGYSAWLHSLNFLYGESPVTTELGSSASEYDPSGESAVNRLYSLDEMSLEYH